MIPRLNKHCFLLHPISSHGKRMLLVNNRNEKISLDYLHKKVKIDDEIKNNKIPRRMHFATHFLFTQKVLHSF